MKRTPWTRIKNARRLLSSSNGICSSFRVGVLFNDPYRCAMTSHSTHLPPACPRTMGVRVPFQQAFLRGTSCPFVVKALFSISFPHGFLRVLRDLCGSMFFLFHSPTLNLVNPFSCTRSLGIRYWNFEPLQQKRLSLWRGPLCAGGRGYHPLMGVRTSPTKKTLSLARVFMCWGQRIRTSIG